MEKYKKIIQALMPFENFDAFAFGIVDFKEMKFSAFEADYFGEELQFRDHSSLYFDLASLTKPLTNSLSFFLAPEKFDEKMKLCLNHRGGLPAWGLLAKDNWKEQILGYPISESETLYSDFSALRVLLELNKRGINQKNMCQQVWDQETLFWTDLSDKNNSPQYGFREGQPNLKTVHDPNAWVIHDYCSHAGLFSTIHGLCQTLLNYQNKTQFIEKVKADLVSHPHRFSFGWDRVQNPLQTLAGSGCGPLTFGHLGFTGTSIWIDPERMRGHVILSNATKYFWYDKAGLNDLRKALGELVWKSII
jgi:hypothetical protein